MSQMYHALVLWALKRHFGQRKWLAKNGDLIAVAIDTDLVRCYGNAEVQLRDTLHANEFQTIWRVVCLSLLNVPFH